MPLPRPVPCRATVDMFIPTCMRGGNAALRIIQDSASHLNQVWRWHASTYISTKQMHVDNVASIPLFCPQFPCALTILPSLPI